MQFSEGELLVEFAELICARFPAYVRFDTRVLVEYGNLRKQEPGAIARPVFGDFQQFVVVISLEIVWDA